MTDKHSSFPRNESGDESLDRLLGALREVEPPPRPDDAEIIKRLNELPPSRSSWITTLIERTNKMPASIRYGVAATLLAVAILFGLLPGSSNPVFGDVDRAIKQKKTVSISVEIDVLMPNHKSQEKRKILASPEPLRLRTETQDGKIEILDLQGEKRLLLDPKQKEATLQPFPKSKRGGPKTLLDVLNLHFSTEENPAPDHQKLDGKDLLVYRVEKPIGNGKSILKESMWVDPESNLPVRITGDIVSTDPKMSQYYSRVVMSNFEWDATPDDVADPFSTTPPEGYTLNTVEVPKGRGGLRGRAATPK